MYVGWIVGKLALRTISACGRVVTCVFIMATCHDRRKLAWCSDENGSVGSRQHERKRAWRRHVTTGQRVSRGTVLGHGEQLSHGIRPKNVQRHAVGM